MMKPEKKRLLLIEDDIIDQKAFKRFADQAEFPYEYDIAGSVKEAKRSLKSNRYDVILADYSLGDGTAFDVLKDLENIPMVIVTGTGDEEIAVEAMKLGAYDYLIKDLNGHYLKMVPVTVENAINRFRAEHELQKYHKNLEKLVDERTVELKRNEQFLYSILESVQEGISVLDPDLNILHVNGTMKRWYGKNTPLEGKKCYQVFQSLGKPCNPCPTLRCLESSKTEYNIVTGPPGSPVEWIELFSYPIKDPNSEKVIGVVEFVRDITERKQVEDTLRKSESRLKESQQITHMGQWELDLVNNHLYWSDGIYNLFEIDPDKFAATYEAFINAIHPDDRDFVNKAYTESLKNKTPYDIIHRLLLQDGKIKYVNEICRTEYDKDGKATRSIGTIQDITELKQTEKELEKHKEHLEELVEERTKELEAFSYSVSHDLRAPLRAIDGFTRILMEDYTKKLDAEGERLGTLIRQNTRMMGQLIDDLLDFSRLGRATIRLSKISMTSLVNDIYYEATTQEKQQRVKFTISDLPEMVGDPTMMRLVWTNLISNALKFSAHREQAVISVTCREEENKLTYCIKDNGAGFKMKYKDKLFGVFQRLHSEREFEGTGVGLALVQRIIHRHGGEVWGEGEVDKGATFYFSIPKNGRT